MSASINHADDYLWDRRWKIINRAQLSTLYHRKRERFFDFWDRFIKGVAIIGGSAAFARLGSPDVTAYAAGLVAVSSTFSLVFGLSERARRHSDLARQFIMLEADITAKGEREFTEPDINRWDAKVREIEAAEPPAHRALVITCQNELAIAHNQGESVHPLGWWQRSLRHFVG
mgnify:CR=1 FL=1